MDPPSREEVAVALREMQEEDMGVDPELQARVDSLASMMNGKKPPMETLAQTDPRKLAKSAKSALAAYARWARNHPLRTEEQRASLGKLVNAWRSVQSDGDAPPHARLSELHAAIARHGPGDFPRWRRYILACRRCEAATDADTGRVPTKKNDPEEEDDEDEEAEAYEERREQCTVEEVQAAVQKDWSVAKEKVKRTAEKAKVTKFVVQRRQVLTGRRAERVVAGRATVSGSRSGFVDGDGFFVEEETKEAEEDDDGRPAHLDGYSYTDDRSLIILYLELSRSVLAQDLDVAIKARTLFVAHRGKTLVNRRWKNVVDPFAEETTWYLEDAMVRLEVAKQHDERDGFFARDGSGPDYFDVQQREERPTEEEEEGPELWHSVFEGDPYRHNRTTKQPDSFAWAQTPTQITVTCVVPKHTTASDVSVTLMRDSLRVYLKRKGALVDGTLNRSVNVGDSTWFLEPGLLTVVLTKLDMAQPWQRLIAGRGDDHNALDADTLLHRAAPDDLDLPSYDDMSAYDKQLALTARDFHRARAQKDFAKADELLADVDDHVPKLIQTDLDRSHRAEWQARLQQHDDDALKLQHQQHG